MSAVAFDLGVVSLLLAGTFGGVSALAMKNGSDRAVQIRAVEAACRERPGGRTVFEVSAAGGEVARCAVSFAEMPRGAALPAVEARCRERTEGRLVSEPTGGAGRVHRCATGFADAPGTAR